MPDTSGPWRYGSVMAACAHCGATLPPGRARQYCSPACRQAAYRRRASSAWPAPPHLPPGRTRTSAGVYQCPGCGEILTITELLDIG